MIRTNPAMDLRQKALEAREQSTSLFQLGRSLLNQGKEVEAKQIKQSAIAKSEESTRLVRASWELEQTLGTFYNSMVSV